MASSITNPRTKILNKGPSIRHDINSLHTHHKLNLNDTTTKNQVLVRIEKSNKMRGPIAKTMCGLHQFLYQLGLRHVFV